MNIVPSNLPTDPNKPLNEVLAPPPPVVEGGNVAPVPMDAYNTFNEFISRYAEANPASGLAALQMTPESLAVLAGKKGVGETSQVLSGIGSAARGFAEGWQNTRNQQLQQSMIQQKQQQTQVKAEADKQERINKVIGDITSGIKSDTNFQDEITRADAISQAKDLIKNGASYGDKFLETFKPVFMQIIRPEFKRLTGAEPEGAGSVTDIIRVLTSNGLIKGFDVNSESWQKLLKGGVINKDLTSDFTAIVNDFEKKNKENYARYAQPHVNKFKDMGAAEYTSNYIQPPPGYSLNPPKVGDRQFNASGDPIIYTENGWVLEEPK